MKVKQKLPPFARAKSRTAGSVDAETGARRVKDRVKDRDGWERKGQMDGEADGCGEARMDGDSP